MEQELKFRLGSPIPPRTVESLDLTPFHLTDLSLHLLSDTVLDTADEQVVGSERSFRIRRDGNETLVTLKGKRDGSGHLHSREEIEVPISPENAENQIWPDEVATALGSDLVTEHFYPIVRVENVRHAWLIRDDTRVLAELAVDSGRLIVPGGEEPFAELEVELKGGTLADLDAIEGCLRSKLPLEPEHKSKLERGLELRKRVGVVAPGKAVGEWLPEFRVPDPPMHRFTEESIAGMGEPVHVELKDTTPVISEEDPWSFAAVVSDSVLATESSNPEGPVNQSVDFEPAVVNSESAVLTLSGPTLSKVAAEIISNNMVKLREAEPAARMGTDPEGVHDLRVATRRLRTALQVYNLRRKGGKAQEMREALSVLMDTASSVRDLEVIWESLDDLGEEYSPLRQEMQQRIDDSRRKLANLLDKSKIRRLLNDVDGFAQKLSDDDEDDLPASLFIGTALWSAYEEVLRRGQVMSEDDHNSLHQVRIGIKRLRYTIEFFKSVLPNEKPLRELLEDAQEELGAFHDDVVAAELLQSLGWPGQEIKKLVDERETDAARQAHEFIVTGWPRIAGPEYRRQLTKSLGNVTK